MVFTLYSIVSLTTTVITTFLYIDNLSYLLIKQNRLFLCIEPSYLIKIILFMLSTNKKASETLALI